MPDEYFRCSYLIVDQYPEEIEPGGLDTQIEVIGLVEGRRQ
jgi:hypothetical protein